MTSIALPKPPQSCSVASQRPAALDYVHQLEQSYLELADDLKLCDSYRRHAIKSCYAIGTELAQYKKKPNHRITSTMKLSKDKKLIGACSQDLRSLNTFLTELGVAEVEFSSG